MAAAGTSTSARKPAAVAFLLWLFFAPLGLHKFYLGKIWQGILYLLLGICGPIPFGLLTYLLFSTGGGDHGVGIAMLYGCLLFGALSVPYLVWWTVDLFTLRRQVEKAAGPPAGSGRGAGSDQEGRPGPP